MSVTANGHALSFFLRHLRVTLCLVPAGTSRRTDVVPTSMWRHFVVSASVERRNDVMSLLGCPYEKTQR